MVAQRERESTSLTGLRRCLRSLTVPPPRLAAAHAAAHAATVAATVAATLLLANTADAKEDTVHVGAEVGIGTQFFPATEDFTEYAVAGFNVGVHGLYGVTDAVNLRASLDLRFFDLPTPETSALFYTGLVGAEYVLDTTDWVLYGGIGAGPTAFAVQEGGAVQTGTTWLAALEIPIGVSYLLSDRFALRLLEGRFRFHFFGPATGPGEAMMVTTGLEVMF